MALNKNTISFLNEHNTDTFFINKLIVSNFLFSNNILKVNNKLVNELVIKFDHIEYPILKQFVDVQKIQNFEELIEAFEFVISPSDKILNGAVYTPKFIRDYLVQNCIMKANGELGTLKIADISCGCGGFLLTATEYIKNETLKSYYDIFRENIYGIDIEKYSIERTKILLTLYAIVSGDDRDEFIFNLVENNSLIYDWRAENTSINDSNGFDIIVGNPPYVCSRNMDKITLELLKNIDVSNSGHPDLYIPFFQIGIENLNNNGILGYITVNTFLKSINGRALRAYFDTNNINLTVLNFGGEQLFKDRNTYTCLCFISFQNPEINYIRTSPNNLNYLNIEDLMKYQYKDLDHKDGWNLVNNNNTLAFINKIENTGIPFTKFYKTRNGIATLKNNVYKFKPIREDDEYYYFIYKKKEYSVEKSICRDIVNANKIKRQSDLKKLVEKIIFPYDKELKIIKENILKTKYPRTYNYLSLMKTILSTRDKGNKVYEEWFAYGRRQSLDINKYKLFFPHICIKPNFVICENKDLLFYNGIAIISDQIADLSIAKKILESEIFYNYISKSTKDYASGYISLSKNYIKNFGICELNKDEANYLSKISSEAEIDDFLNTKYMIT